MIKTHHAKNEEYGIWSHPIKSKNWQAMETVTDLIFLAPKSLQMVTEAMKLKDACSFEEKL